MIFYIFCGIALVVAVAMVVEAFMDGEGAWAVIGIVFGFLVVAVGGLVCMFMTLPSINQYERKPEVYELKQLALDSNVKGSFFLGIGSVDEENSYIYYRESGSGYVIDSVPVESTTIIEDSTTPRLEVINTYADSWIVPGWFGPWESNYVIHVPEGSITTGVSINLN